MKICIICGVAFRVKPSQFYIRKTCSRKCASHLLSRTRTKRKKDAAFLLCTKCHAYKKHDKFGKNKESIKSWCFRCCAKEQRERNINHPEVGKNYKKSNIKKVRQWKKNSVQRLKHTASYKAQRKRAKLKSVSEIRDNYLKSNMKRDGIPITPETIELKRQQIIMKRTLKEFKKWREEYESNHTDVHGKQFENEENNGQQL
jgi:hypothetical protein